METYKILLGYFGKNMVLLHDCITEIKHYGRCKYCRMYRCLMTESGYDNCYNSRDLSFTFICNVCGKKNIFSYNDFDKKFLEKNVKDNMFDGNNDFCVNNRWRYE